jgi:tetratricopeptide (TPR) repeat protein
MRLFLPSAAILLVFTAALGDTIVLKNGRRVVADSVTEEDTRVVYETALGKFSLAKSLVDHIEHDGARPAPSGPNVRSDVVREQAPVPTISISAPPARVIQDDAVDRKYLNELARQRQPTPVQRELMVVSFLAAVEFEIDHGRLDSALDIARTGAIAAPNEARMLVGQSIVYLHRQEYRLAREMLGRARSLAPDSAEVWKLLGFAEYSSDRVADAVESWKKSLRLAKDPEVEKLLERAEREIAAEDRFLEANSNHFTLRFEGGQISPAFRREIMDTLEAQYRELVRDLGGPVDTLPADPILVILYPGQAFYDVTQAPTWSGALFDGKIRVPVEGLSSVTYELRTVFKHEMTHSFVRARSRAKCPAWLNEGAAELEEGKSVSSIAAEMVKGLNGRAVPFAELAEPFSSMGAREAAAAYAISLAAAEMIRDQNGTPAIGSILDRLAGGATIDTAMRDELGYSLDEAGTRLIAYLKKK